RARGAVVIEAVGSATGVAKGFATYVVGRLGEDLGSAAGVGDELGRVSRTDHLDGIGLDNVQAAGHAWYGRDVSQGNSDIFAVNWQGQVLARGEKPKTEDDVRPDISVIIYF